MSATDFPDLIRRVRAGDPAAAADLVGRYAAAIRREVRFRLRDVRARRVVDASDVCQMVLGSFFARAALGQFDLDTPADLLNLLMQIARNKVADQVKREHAARRGGDARAEPLAGANGEPREVEAPGPTPSAVVADRDLIARLAAGLSADERALFELRAEGLSWDEVAARAGGTPEGRRKQYQRAVDRVVNDLALDSLVTGG
ncbi:MAG: sigma-70 family RNA polymerase sigma factor [Gemmataceae bacterium]